MVRLAQLCGELNILQVFWGGLRGVFLAHVGEPVGSDGSLLMCALGTLYTSFAPTGAPALAELGHPDVASGRYSCAARSYGATTSPVSMSPREGALTYHTDSPPHPNTYLVPWRAVCGTSPEYSPPRLRAHSSQAESPTVRPRCNLHPLLHLPGEGERKR